MFNIFFKLFIVHSPLVETIGTRLPHPRQQEFVDEEMDKCDVADDYDNLNHHSKVQLGYVCECLFQGIPVRIFQ